MGQVGHARNRNANDPPILDTVYTFDCSYKYMSTISNASSFTVTCLSNTVAGSDLVTAAWSVPNPPDCICKCLFFIQNIFGLFVYLLVLEYKQINEQFYVVCSYIV